MCREGEPLLQKQSASAAAAATKVLEKEDATQSKDSAKTGKTTAVPGQTDFHWSHSGEPHAIRRKLILEKHPEIKELYGHDPYMRYTCLFLVSLQFTLAYLAPQMNNWVFWITAYVVGGTANHMLMLAIHELSHNLGFAKPKDNRLFGLFCNLPMGVPSAVSFKRYHMEHHKYQGEDGIDVDIPTILEGRIFNNAITKAVFVFFQVVFYALRPGIVNPKKPTLWEGINWCTALSFDAMVYLVLGPKALGYLLLSSLLGAGMHPVAGHFIAEHYVFEEGAETYSYYGWLNIFAFNGTSPMVHSLPYAACQSSIPHIY